MHQAWRNHLVHLPSANSECHATGLKRLFELCHILTAVSSRCVKELPKARLRLAVAPPLPDYMKEGEDGEKKGGKEEVRRCDPTSVESLTCLGGHFQGNARMLFWSCRIVKCTES